MNVVTITDQLYTESTISLMLSLTSSTYNISFPSSIKIPEVLGDVCDIDTHLWLDILKSIILCKFTVSGC